MKLLLAALLMAAPTGLAFADDAPYTPERRALLVSIIEGLGCKVDGVSPPQEFLDAMEEHAFIRDETNAIAHDLVAEGLANHDGPTMILKTENCS